jgi:uroporphyrin-III C-methyltransferase
VLLVENASRGDERRLLTTLGGLAETAAGLEGPAILIIGEVAALAEVEGVVDVAQARLKPRWKRA